VSSSLNDGDEDRESARQPGSALARLDALPPDSLHEVEAVIDGDAESLLVYRDAGGVVRAWLNVCPHAGRRLDWAPGKFLRAKDGALVCAAHGASFDLANGECIAGPCRGERLRDIAVELRGDDLWLAADS
jgi:nitrite reductase/ring-hydroxylating ferredoxin subunit